MSGERFAKAGAVHRRPEMTEAKIAREPTRLSRGEFLRLVSSGVGALTLSSCGVPFVGDQGSLPKAPRTGETGRVRKHNLEAAPLEFDVGGRKVDTELHKESLVASGVYAGEEITGDQRERKECHRRQERGGKERYRIPASAYPPLEQARSKLAKDSARTGHDEHAAPRDGEHQDEVAKQRVPLDESFDGFHEMANLLSGLSML